jgi:hypothetical protein
VPAGFRLFATPWWVNVLVLVPIVSGYYWRRTGLGFELRHLVAAALFGLAFGFVEAAVVVYLRGAVRLFPDHGVPPDQLLLLDIPRRLLAIEVVREAATMVMLLTIAALAARRARERCAMRSRASPGPVPLRGRPGRFMSRLSWRNNLPFMRALT